MLDVLAQHRSQMAFCQTCIRLAEKAARAQMDPDPLVYLLQVVCWRAEELRELMVKLQIVARDAVQLCNALKSSPIVQMQAAN